MKTQNIIIRKAKERGHANYGWLNTYHTFAFGNYYDSRYMGFRSLRVINDDTIKPGAGFEPHRHKDMEIISYVVQGALEHKDNLGHGSMITQGNFQRMTAGSGVEHSEFNPSQDTATRLLQIWILPDQPGLEPSYEDFFPPRSKTPLQLIASNEPSKSAMTIHQDARVHLGRLKEYETVTYTAGPGRGLWLQIITGKIKLLNAWVLSQGDGAAIENETQVQITSLTDAEFLLFDLAP